MALLLLPACARDSSPAAAAVAPPGSSFHQQRLANALQGLVYDDGRVRIDPSTPLGGPVSGAAKTFAEASYGEGNEALEKNLLISAIGAYTTGMSGANRNVDLYFSSSTDQGTTWTVPRVINQDAVPPGDEFFPWLEVDSRGILHLSFFDSRNTVQNDNVLHGMFDVYYGVSVPVACWHSDRRPPGRERRSRDDRPLL